MLRIHSFLVIIFLFLTIDSYGQYGWLRSYGGSKDEIGKSIVKSGNTYYITGLTNSSDNDFQGLNKGESDIIVLNISEKGKLNWKKTFGGLFRDEGISISSTIDGGCIISGYTESNNGDFKSMNKGYNDIFIIRLDSLGNLIWKKTFGGISGEIGISITSSPVFGM
jgi:hypothetical protein